jgi:suppressor of fused-like protein
METGDEAPGWDAIDAALRKLYPGVEPDHRAPIPGVHFGGGVQGISAYRAANHWHLVTFGLTELWTKDQGSDPDVSGWGYEMTFRVTSLPEEKRAPEWPFNVLVALAKHTQNNGKPFWLGDRIDFGGPIDAGTSRFTALAVAMDPELPILHTPNGQMAFHQLVGITADQLAEMKQTSTASVLEKLQGTNSLLLTDRL